MSEHKTNASSVVPDASSYKSPEDKARTFLEQFRMESEKVRALVLKDICAMDTLARIGVTDYQELSLECIAQERGIPFNRFDPPIPACPNCGCISGTLITDKKNLYYCPDCGRKFTPNANSIVSNAKVPLLTYAKLLHCLLNYETVAKTCELCDISFNSYYNIRNHLYYAISAYLEKLSLFGQIQIDETYLNLSYKGTSLQKTDFDEEDDRFAQTYKPRDSRKRGGALSKSEANANKICIFTAVDDRGYVHSCYAGIGQPNVSTLKRNVQASKFLDTVPATNVFAYPLKPPRATNIEPGSRSLLIFDGSRVLRRFADSVVCMDSYARVYRRNGIQMKPPAAFKHLNTQRVNYVHRRLKEHIFRTGSGSSRYIKGTLLLFDYMFNTGAPHNKEAVDALLRILVQPGLGQSPAFYNNYFSLPNHLFEWYSDTNALSKLPYPKIYAYSLYDRYKNPAAYPNAPTPTLEEIQEACGLSLPTIRSTYKDYKAAGYHDRIISHFSHAVFAPDAEEGALACRRDTMVSRNNIDAAALEIFDRYTTEHSKPYLLRKSLSTICDEVNKEFRTHYSAQNFSRCRKLIVELGLREKIPERTVTDKFLNGYPVTEACFFYLEQYDALRDEAVQQGKPPPTSTEIYDALAKKFPKCSRKTIVSYVGQARRYLKRPKSGQEKNPIWDEIYNQYSEYRRTHWVDSKQESRFWADIFRQYNLNASVHWAKTRMWHLSKEAETESKQPLPDYLPSPPLPPPSRPLTNCVLKVVEACNQIKQQRETAGLAPLTLIEMVQEIKKDSRLAESTIRQYLTHARVPFP